MINLGGDGKKAFQFVSLKTGTSIELLPNQATPSALGLHGPATSSTSFLLTSTQNAVGVNVEDPPGKACSWSFETAPLESGKAQAALTKALHINHACILLMSLNVSSNTLTAAQSELFMRTERGIRTVALLRASHPSLFSSSASAQPSLNATIDRLVKNAKESYITAPGVHRAFIDSLCDETTLRDYFTRFQPHSQYQQPLTALGWKVEHCEYASMLSVLEQQAAELNKHIETLRRAPGEIPSMLPMISAYLTKWSAKIVGFLSHAVRKYRIQKHNFSLWNQVPLATRDYFENVSEIVPFVRKCEMAPQLCVHMTETMASINDAATKGRRFNEQFGEFLPVDLRLHFTNTFATFSSLEAHAIITGLQKVAEEACSKEICAIERMEIMAQEMEMLRLDLIAAQVHLQQLKDSSSSQSQSQPPPSQPSSSETNAAQHVSTRSIGKSLSSTSPSLISIGPSVSIGGGGTSGHNSLNSLHGSLNSSYFTDANNNNAAMQMASIADDAFAENTRATSMVHKILALQTENAQLMEKLAATARKDSIVSLTQVADDSLPNSTSSSSSSSSPSNASFSSPSSKSNGTSPLRPRPEDIIKQHANGGTTASPSSPSSPSSATTTTTDTAAAATTFPQMILRSIGPNTSILPFSQHEGAPSIATAAIIPSSPSSAAKDEELAILRHQTTDLRDQVHGLSVQVGRVSDMFRAEKQRCASLEVSLVGEAVARKNAEDTAAQMLRKVNDMRSDADRQREAMKRETEYQLQMALQQATSSTTDREQRIIASAEAEASKSRQHLIYLESQLSNAQQNLQLLETQKVQLEQGLGSRVATQSLMLTEAEAKLAKMHRQYADGLNKREAENNNLHSEYKVTKKELDECCKALQAAHQEIRRLREALASTIAALRAQQIESIRLYH